MDLQPWHSVLCNDCGIAVHDFIANQRQLMQETQKPFGENK
jgi:hypothetical protein